MLNTILLILLGNAAIGLLLYMHAWNSCGPLRAKGYKERDSKYPQYRRLDIHLWDQKKFILGAMTILLPKLLIMIVLCLSILLISTIIFFRYDFSK